MDLDTKLELQLEILTLDRNIKQFKKNGWSTENMKARLKACRSKLKKLITTDYKSLQSKYISVQHHQCGV